MPDAKLQLGYFYPVARPVDPGFGVGGNRPVDPGYGLPEGTLPDNSLPPGSPGVPSHPIELPEPPPGIWPPPTPSHPIQPAPPGTPPGSIWPPVLPAHPGAPDQTLPGQLPGAEHPIALPPTKFWVVAGIPGYGWRYICVEPSAGHPSHPIAPPGSSAPTPTPHR